MWLVRFAHQPHDLHSGGTLVGGRMTSAPSFHSLRTRCAAYGDDRRDTSLSGRLTCVQALAKLCRFASEPRARPNVWPEPRSGGPEGRPKGRLSVGEAESSPPAIRARAAPTASGRSLRDNTSLRVIRLGRRPPQLALRGY